MKPALDRRAAISLAAGIVLCGVAGSEAELARGIAPASLRAPSAAAIAPPAPASAPAKPKPAPGREIDALVEAVSRKYRVSQSAAREFVATAYREGWRLGVDPVLIVAVMAIESSFNPVAESEGGAVGLMQVIPRFHADKIAAIPGASVLDPHLNIQLGTRVLKEYLLRGGTEIAGLQLYNGSSGDTTNAYAMRVLREKERLQEAIRRGSPGKRASGDREPTAAIAADKITTQTGVREA